MAFEVLPCYLITNIDIGPPHAALRNTCTCLADVVYLR